MLVQNFFAPFEIANFVYMPFYTYTEQYITEIFDFTGILLYYRSFELLIAF